MQFLEIKAVKHPIVKEIKDLKSTNFSKFILKGEELVSFFSKNREKNYKVLYCFASEEELLNEAYSNLKIEYNKFFICSPAVLRSMDIDQRHNIALVIEREDNIGKNIDNKIDSMALVLDNIKDYGNIGSIIRSAYLFGIKNIILINKFNCFYDKIVASSRGLIFKMNLYLFKEVSEAQEFLHKHSYKILLASLDGTNLSAYNKPKGRIALVLGNETMGPTQSWQDIAQEKITIQMKGTESCDSLNVACAASIIMYYLNNN